MRVKLSLTRLLSVTVHVFGAGLWQACFLVEGMETALLIVIFVKRFLHFFKLHGVSSGGGHGLGSQCLYLLPDRCKGVIP